MDRLLHRMAFSGTDIQLSLADIEDRLYAADLKRIQVRKPVFITSLPRAGTTRLLECIAALPEFASHTYRRMPFLFCPLIWATISRGLRKSEAAQQRAHGDGVMISFDSPEAFEEAIWRHFWPGKYKTGTIRTWQASDRNAEFETFLSAHIRKLLLIDRWEGGSATRYVSKNNANIARLDLLPVLYPDAVILVPFRDPIEHAASLLRQHLNFARIHDTDPFALDYMRAIGHLEFGALRRQIRLAPDTPSPEGAPTDISFWLEYWIATFSRLERLQSANVHLISYEGLCGAPDAAGRLLHRLGVSDDLDALRAAMSDFRLPASHAVDRNAIAPALLQEANSVYSRLLNGAR